MRAKNRSGYPVYPKSSSEVGDRAKGQKDDRRYGRGERSLHAGREHPDNNRVHHHDYS